MSPPAKVKGPGKKRSWHTISKVPDAQMKLAANHGSALFMASVRDLIPAVALIAVIVLGSKGTTFGLGVYAMGSVSLSVDVQLAAIGLVNKIADMFVQASLKHTASIILTMWMAVGSSKHRGVSLLDFDLKSELTQPWTCIYNFHKRRKLHGWGALGSAGIFRFVVSLSISCCVLFLALAINTVGIPKQRWHPNNGGSSGYQITDEVRRLLTITTPRMQLHSLDWGDTWGQAWDMVGSGPPSWDAAAAFAATSAYTTLGGIANPYREARPGWKRISKETDDFTTGVNTLIGDGAVHTVSVQHSRMRETFEYLRANGSHAFQRDSTGWMGSLKVTMPMLTTICHPSPTHSSVSKNDITVALHDDLASVATLDIFIGAVASLNFTSTSCQMTLQQVLVPVSQWFGDLGPINIVINDLNRDGISIPSPLNASSSNHGCAKSLRDQLINTLTRMDRLLDTGIVHHMALTARRLADLNKDFSKTSAPDAASMAPVIAVIAQHLLTIASWNMTASPDPGETVESYPMRWQVYGSGPRLAWEWAAAAILAVVLLAVLVGGLFGLVLGIESGPWLETAGIMLLANQSKPMESSKGSVGGVISQKASEGRYYLRESATGGEHSLVLVDDSASPQDTRDICRTKTYTNEGHVIITSRRVDWQFFRPRFSPIRDWVNKVRQSYKKRAKP